MNRRGFLGALLGAAFAPAGLPTSLVPSYLPPSARPIIGWSYEPPLPGLSDWYPDEFGPRFDRAILPGSLALFMK